MSSGAPMVLVHYILLHTSLSGDVTGIKVNMEADVHTGVNSHFFGAIATIVQRCLFSSYSGEKYSEENKSPLST